MTKPKPKSKPKPHPRPQPKKVFIGSSTTFIKLAHAFRMTFESDTSLDVTVWDLSRWRDNYDNLTALIGFLDQFQFGIFLLTPDDTLIQKAKGRGKLQAPRDNVIFELGMWFGRAGRDRTWFVVPKNVAVKTPTDLDGLNPIKYSHPEQDDYERNPSTHFLNAFANAHDLIIENISEYQRRASEANFFAARIHLLQNLLKNASEDDARRIVKEGLSQLFLERAAIGRTSMADTLRDVLIWTRSLLDGLDSEQLAEAQGNEISEVWVFSPEPLEIVNGLDAKSLRSTVVHNIFERGVRYRYYVENDSQKARIKAFLTNASKGRRNADRVLKEKVNFSLLPEEAFLSYFTVHLFSADCNVYQSVTRDNRDDFIVKLDSGRASAIKRMIEKLSLNNGSISPKRET